MLCATQQTSGSCRGAAAVKTQQAAARLTHQSPRARPSSALCAVGQAKTLASGSSASSSAATSASQPHPVAASRTLVVACSAPESPGAGADAEAQPGPDKKWIVAGSVATGAAVLLGVGVAMSTPQGALFKDLLVNGPLGRSGFLAAFSLIFLSEIGDKTFFIAALLAMKLGKWISFAGSLTSLSVMTIVSVAIGAVFSRVPDALKSSVPIGELAGVILLIVFGVRALREGLQADDPSASSTADEELADATEAVAAAEQGGKMRRAAPIKAFFEVASLIFIAEWGDRSMLATIALGAAQNPVGVASGAVVGHALATGIAVLGGALASKYVSERTINLTSGVLFLVFAAATAYSLL